MDRQKADPRTKTHIPLLSGLLGAVFVFSMLLIYMTNNGLSNYALHFNPYALISLAAALTFAYLMTAILRKHFQSPEVKWFVLYLSGGLVYALTEVLWRMSVHRQGALLWSQLNFIGVSLIPIAFYLFAINYSGNKHEFPNWAYVPLFLAWSLVVFFAGFGNMLDVTRLNQLVLKPWGWYNGPYIGYAPYLLWIALNLLLGMAVLQRVLAGAKNSIIKKQARWYMISFIVPFFFGLITDGLLPILGINSLPPLALVFGAIGAALSFYGLSNFYFFQLSPELLSDNVLNTMSESVFVVNNEFKIESMNKQAQHLAGISDEDASNQSFLEFFSAESWEKIRSSLNGHIIDSEVGSVRINPRKGNSVPVRVRSTQLVEDGVFLAYVFVISDISDITSSYNKLKDLEEQLRIEKASVEHTVEIRTKELREAQEKLIADDAMKSEFIELASHHLRTPIAIMEGNLDLIKDNAVNDTAKQYVDNLSQGIDRLKKLTEELLAISSMEAGQVLTTEEVKLKDLLMPIIDVFDQKAREKGIRLVRRLNNIDNLSIKANQNLLTMAFSNLLDNALRFTQEGEIIVSVQHTKATATLEIKDTGIGIKEDELNNLFTKFHRGTSSLTSEYQGVGLGLFMSKLIVDKHNGQLDLTSKPNQGTAVTIELPLIS